MKLFNLFFLSLFLLGGMAKAQNCKPSMLYGWATQNGGTQGGNGGTEVVVSTAEQFNTEAKKKGKRIIYVQGILKGELFISSNKTVYGLPGATIKGNVMIKKAKNVVVQNLIIRGDSCKEYKECRAGRDGLNIGKGSVNVWVDHCDIADGQDGNLDIISQSDFVTVSWCRFSYSWKKPHRFSNIIGSGDNHPEDAGHLNITYHHNWWAEGVNQRQPRVRYGKVHVVNNLYTSEDADYIVGSGADSDILFESNVMKTAAKPIHIITEDRKRAFLAKNNLGPAGANQELGKAFTPPYQMPIEEPASIEEVIRGCAGATLGDPRKK